MKKIIQAGFFKSKKALKSPLFPLTLITALASFLRFKQLTFQSLWLDELVTVNHTLKGLKYLLKNLTHFDNMPPFHYILLWIWTSIFGNNEYTTRALSAVIGIIGVIAIYYLAKEIFSKTVGLYTALILSVTTFHIYYSQEVRSYSLLFLTAIMSYLFLVKQIKLPSLKNSLMYTIFTALLIYTHYFGLFIVMSQVVFLLFSIFEIKKKTKLLKYQSLSFLAVGILYIPWTPVVLKLTKMSYFWTKKPTPDFFINYFKIYLGRESFLILIFSVFLLIYLIKDPNKINFSQHRILLTTWLFVTLFIPFFRSFSSPAPLVDRYTICILPAIILMVGSGIHALKEKPVRIFILTSILLMFLVNLFFTRGGYFGSYEKEQWREASQYVIQKDPEKKYKIFANELFSYYFNHIFKHDVNIRQDLFRSNGPKEIFQEIKKGHMEGFWVLEAHEFLDKKKWDYIEKKLVYKDRMIFHGARVSSYVSPRNYPVNNALVSIPLNWLTHREKIIKKNDNFIHIDGMKQITTPKLYFDKGVYRVLITAHFLGTSQHSPKIIINAEDMPNKISNILSNKQKEIDFELSFKNAKSRKINIWMENEQILKNPQTIRFSISKIQVQKKESIKDFLGARKSSINSSIIIISAKDDAKHRLNKDSIIALEEIGLKKIQDFNYKDSYLAIIERGKVIYEDLGQKRLAYKDKNLLAVCAGQSSGNVSYIIIDNIEYSKKERGFNFVIKGPKGIESYYSDTHKDPDNLVKQ